MDAEHPDTSLGTPDKCQNLGVQRPQLNRRKFIKGAAAGAAASAASMPLFSIGKPGPSASGKINVAVVGAGGQGGYAFRRAASEENLAAICDVDFKRAWRALAKHPDVPRFKELKGELAKIPRLPGVGPGPIEEWFAAIKGGPTPGSNFDYSAPRRAGRSRPTVLL